MNGPPAFPRSEDFARAFYDEAIRHLGESRVLHRGGRHAASVTSAMKAAELGIKAAVILQNAMGLYDKVFATHKPLTSVESHPLLTRLISDLDSRRARLSADLRDMERLEPQPFGKGGFDASAEANTEYPFLEKFPDAAGNMTTRLWSPHSYFTEPDALRKYRVAHETLEALAAVYPVILAWGRRLPRKL